MQAFYIAPSRTPMLPSVMVRPCVVTCLFPSTQMAIIEMHSLTVSGRASQFVPFADLASTAEKAIAEATARIQALPLLAVKAIPSPDQKAAIEKMAGAGAGK